ncbi:cupin domain-containing protein [Capillimicrobium parvum]|uniref:Cupin domain-containing protein n=1 Tax=Capillimicrobium parvum TaxID=2884022 RepID=A0A9E6XX13_9ACTN|nr:hypothetical protein [Capillimicrobium parvum]UGS35944.1 hypothetical protein DSM104329_02341 [Capillimicrobium parvum]
MREPLAVRFADAAREPEAPGISSHAIEVGGVRWAVVVYEPGVLREEWCTEGHSGYVLDGAVTYEFADGDPPLALAAGEGFTLPAGGGGHRGRSGPAGVRLFLIDREG